MSVKTKEAVRHDGKMKIRRMRSAMSVLLPTETLTAGDNPAGNTGDEIQPHRGDRQNSGKDQGRGSEG